MKERSKFLDSGFILVSISHALNHAYESLLPILYPLLLSEFGLSYSLIGVISMGYRFSGGLLQLVMGFLGRFFRRKYLLGFGLIWTSLSNAFIVLAQNFSHILVSRSFAGIGSSPQHPTGAAYIADTFPKSQLGKASGINLAFATLGRFTTPFIGSILLVSLGWRNTALVFTIPGLIVGLAFLLMAEEKRSEKWNGMSSFKAMSSGVMDVLKNRVVLIVIVVEMVMAFRIGASDFIPSYLSKVGLTSLETGFLFTVFIGAGLPSPYVWGYLSDRIERRKVVMFAMGSAAILWYLLPLNQTYFGLLSTIIPLGFACQGVGGVIQAYVAEVTLPENRDIIYGIYYTLAFTLGSFSPVIIGYLADSLGFQTSFTYVGIISLFAVVAAYFMK
jgi:FSR family fosmidomycin resistance protein-like MFS transporter